MNRIIKSIILLGLLIIITACPGEGNQNDPFIPPGQEIPPGEEDLKNIVEKPASGKNSDEVLTQLLYIRGIQAVTTTADSLTSVQFSQSPPESDLDTLLAWHTIALAVLDVYGSGQTCEIIQTINQKPEIRISIPLSAAHAFREEQISFDDYRKEFSVLLLNDTVPREDSAVSGDSIEENLSGETPTGAREEVEVLEIATDGTLVEGTLPPEDQAVFYAFETRDSGEYKITCAGASTELILLFVINENGDELANNLDTSGESLLDEVTLYCDADQFYAVAPSGMNDDSRGQPFSLKVEKL